MNFGKIDALVINAGRVNEVIVPIGFVNDIYIANQRNDYEYPQRLDFANLKVRIEGDKNYSWASIKTKWIEAEGVWIITSLYNSHGLYDYANLKG